MNLIEAAKKVEVRKRKHNSYSKEHKELALAWARDEITLYQVQTVLKHSSTSGTYSWLAQCFREMIKNKEL